MYARARGEEIVPFRPRRAPERLRLRAAAGARRRRPRAAAVRPAPAGRRAGAPSCGAGRRDDSRAAPAQLDTTFARDRRRRRSSSLEQRLPEPTAEAEAIERLLYAQFERTPPPAPVAALDLELLDVGPAVGQQLPLFVPQAARSARLGWQLARLALTFGEDRISRVEITDPEAPLAETRWRWLPIDSGARRSPGSDGRRRQRLMTRLLREHPSIDAELDSAGALVAIRWNGRRESVEVCNRWRVEESWWRTPIARDYFKVVGQHWLALVYLDRVDGTLAPRAALRLIAASATRWRGPQRDHDEQDHEQADDEGSASTSRGRWTVCMGGVSGPRRVDMLRRLPRCDTGISTSARLARDVSRWAGSPRRSAPRARSGRCRAAQARRSHAAEGTGASQRG